MPTTRPKHDKIREQWVSNTLLENMLDRYDGVNVLKWNLKVKPFVAQ